MTLSFFPTFDEKQKLTGLDLRFNYEGWAPWNRDLQSDRLLEKVKPLLMKWYGGNDFVTAHLKEKDIPVKLDGNRRIMVYDINYYTSVEFKKSRRHLPFVIIR